MTRSTRRGFLIGSTALPLASAAAAAPDPAAIRADLERYVGFGSKQSGGPGDTACGEWLSAELGRAGFAVEKLPISVPWFAPERCEIASGESRAALWPQPIVVPAADGVSGPLVRVDAVGRAEVPLGGAIALVDLPYGRWSTALAKPVRTPVDTAFAAGARAAVIVTNGPTGKVIALNADGRAPMFAGAVGLLAPADAGPFLAAATRHAPATVTLSGKGGRRPAFNLVGRLVRGNERPWIVVSTPRSGWFACAGERGGGIAAWLHLARWAPRALPRHNLAFLCNSGHEYENLGAEVSLKAAAPRPAETTFWLHLGANLAARDWHEGLLGLEPLAGTDSQRYLVLSAKPLPAARRLFAGLAGLESPYPSTRFSAGELTAILAAGYPQVAGVFGVHRFHHVADDDMRCVPVEAVAATAAAFRELLAEAAKG